MKSIAAKRKFAVVLVFKLDRAFRSVKHMHDTLSAWDLVSVGFKSVREQFDTSTALGRLLLNLLASLAEFELELIRERVKAGMDRARRQGKRIGRPSVWDRRGFNRRFGAILERLNDGDISRRKAAEELGSWWLARHAPATFRAPVDGSSFLAQAQRGETKIDDLYYLVTLRNLRDHIAAAGFTMVREDLEISRLARRTLPEWLVEKIPYIPIGRDVLITNMEYVLSC